MGKRIIGIFIKEFFASGKNIKDSKVLILGLTFKENCSDIRNTKVIDIVNELKNFNAETYIVDPLANIEKANLEYNLKIKISYQMILNLMG